VTCSSSSGSSGHSIIINQGQGLEV
jgi:hypothetical protein